MSIAEEKPLTEEKPEAEELSPELQEKLARLHERLAGFAKVRTAPSGTQYILAAELLLSRRIQEEMRRLSEAVQLKRAKHSR